MNDLICECVNQSNTYMHVLLFDAYEEALLAFVLQLVHILCTDIFISITLNGKCLC